MTTRWRCPPESWSGGRVEHRVRQPHRRQQARAPYLPVCRSRLAQARRAAPQPPADDGGRHLWRGVEGRAGRLEDHLDQALSGTARAAAAAVRGQRPAVEPATVPAEGGTRPWATTLAEGRLASTRSRRPAPPSRPRPHRECRCRAAPRCLGHRSCARPPRSPKKRRRPSRYGTRDTPAGAWGGPPSRRRCRSRRAGAPGAWSGTRARMLRRAAAGPASNPGSAARTGSPAGSRRGSGARLPRSRLSRPSNAWLVEAKRGHGSRPGRARRGAGGAVSNALRSRPPRPALARVEATPTRSAHLPLPRRGRG